MLINIEQNKRLEQAEQGQGDANTAATAAGEGSTGGTKAPEDLETEEAKKLVEKLTESGASSRDEATTREIVSVAARVVGSLSDTDFEIAFNPDVFQDHVKHAKPEVRTFSHMHGFISYNASQRKVHTFGLVQL